MVRAVLIVLFLIALGEAILIEPTVWYTFGFVAKITSCMVAIMFVGDTKEYYKILYSSLVIYMLVTVVMCLGYIYFSFLVSLILILLLCLKIYLI